MYFSLLIIECCDASNNRSIWDERPLDQHVYATRCPGMHEPARNTSIPANKQRKKALSKCESMSMSNSANCIVTHFENLEVSNSRRTDSHNQDGEYCCRCYCPFLFSNWNFNENMSYSFSIGFCFVLSFYLAQLPQTGLYSDVVKHRLLHSMSWGGWAGSAAGIVGIWLAGCWLDWLLELDPFKLFCGRLWNWFWLGVGICWFDCLWFGKFCIGKPWLGKPENPWLSKSGLRNPKLPWLLKFWLGKPKLPNGWLNPGFGLPPKNPGLKPWFG